MDEAILLYSLHQDEILFIDYTTKQQIYRLPPFADPIDVEYLYDFAIAKRTECLQNIQNVTAVAGRPPEPRGKDIRLIIVHSSLL